MKILLAGATGFIGKPLLQELIRNKHEIYLLSRHTPKNVPASAIVLNWDGKNLGNWTVQAKDADAVINLSGEGIANERWTAKRKQTLIDSRVQSTRALVSFMKQMPRKPSVFINASAVGYYGNVPSGNVTETSPKGHGFLAETCELWELEAKAAEELGIRTVLCRLGIVLEKDGGAMAKMLPPFKFFAGGPLGSGEQWFPWIHRDDVIGAILFALENPSISGPVNFTAPSPVTMKIFSQKLGETIHRPSWAPVPGFMLHLMLGEMASMLLEGQCAVPQKLSKAGYHFKYASVEEALKAAV